MIDPGDVDPQYFQEWAHAALTAKAGTERLITGKNGEIFYSPNHYRGFIRLDDDSLDIIGDLR